MPAENIRIVAGDIAKATEDAIVNAANERMLGGGGVDGAIHRAAGPALLKACLQIPGVNGIRCPAGEARITTAGDLRSRFVIHTVGPRYHSTDQPEKLLASAYSRSLQLALDHNCKSVAFPAISCGVFGYPLKEAANIAISTCSDPEFNTLDIRFYLLDDETLQSWKEALADRTS